MRQTVAPFPANDDPVVLNTSAKLPVLVEVTFRGNSMAANAENPLLQHAEVALKIGTAVIAILYFFGLMISNAQLMELGIADFASLQARNVTVGMLFVIYLLIIAVIVAPLAVILPFCARKDVMVGATVWTYVAVIIALLLLGVLALLAAGQVVGYLLPWGRTWGSYFPISINDFFRDVLSQLREAFFRKEILLVAGYLILVEIALLFWVWKKRYSKESSDTIALRGENPFKILIAVLLVLSLPIFALFDYADKVYPNFRFNLGGGQPQVTNLVLTGKKSEMAGFSSAGLVSAPVCCGGVDDETIEIQDIAIWYQSDKFLYIANAGHQMKSRVVAIDLKLVRSIHYLPKHVRVSSGAHIYKLDWNLR
jgi:hypothetical protein